MRAALICLALASPAAAAPCGGDFAAFITSMQAEAIAAGVPADEAPAFITGARQDEKVLKADRAQGVFRKGFPEFSQSLMSKQRLAAAREKSASLDAIFARAEADCGVSRGILLAFWAFETDFGRVQGDFNIRNALLTLAHDCRRPALFRPQALAAARLFALDEFDLDTTGTWTGEIGTVQMLPQDILERGVDGDGDGLILLKSSESDAILSGANLLQHHGWRAGEPWLVEVTLPRHFDWSLRGPESERPTAKWDALGVSPRQGSLAPGLGASLLLPQGHKGPAFLAYPNFRVLFDRNQSFIYVTTTACFATRIEGADPYLAGTPDPVPELDQMKALQTRLAALGHDVGQIDGILGAGTRAAVQKEQARLDLPADGWPTRALLDAL
jgi:lytic murein transglycosylase